MFIAINVVLLLTPAAERLSVEAWLSSRRGR
jgi:hypothetical protein